MTAPVDLAQYRQLRDELAQVDARRAALVRALQANDMLIAAVQASEQPLLPIEGLARTGRRATTRYGRAAGAKLNKTDRRVLRVIGKGPIGFSDLQATTAINKWTLRDSIDRLLVAGEVRRFGQARATRFVKASLKTKTADTSLLGFLMNS